MIQQLVNAITDSAFSGWLQATYWLWPVLEILHFVGLSLLFGGLLIVDLRLLGCFAGVSPAQTRRLLVLVLLGFGINLVTGILFIFGDPGRYAINIAFQIKMGLILLAGLNAAVFHYWVLPRSGEGGPWPAVSALASLLAWTSVLLLGRLIPYIGTG